VADVDGNVGIGTSSPSVELHVSQTSTAASVVVERTDGRFVELLGGSLFSTIGFDSAGRLQIGPVTSIGVIPDDASSLVISSTGNVGIGTSSPTSKLEVNGSVNISGTGVGDFIVNNSNLFVDVSAGRVGIGIAAPSYTLEVVGNISVGSYDHIFNTYDNVKVLNTLESLDTIGGNADTLFTFSQMGPFSVGFTYPVSTSATRAISSSKDYGDLTNFSHDEDHLEFFLYTSNSSAMGSTLVAELGNTQDSAEYQWVKSQGFPTLVDGWNKVVLRMGDASQGSVDWSTGVDHFRIIFSGTSGPAFNFSIDDLRMTSNRKASVSRDLALDGDLTVFGNVGIGTSSPSAALEIFGSESTTDGLDAAIEIENNATGGDSWFLRVGADGTNTPSGGFSIADTGAYRLSITGTGDVGIGTTSPGVQLHVQDTIDGNIFRLQDSDGTCNQNPEAGSITTSCSSDEKLKEDIHEADSVLDDFKKIKVKDYIVKASGDEVTGVVAQEIQETNPELVEDINGTLFVEVPNPWKLLKAIQELQEMFESLVGGNYSVDSKPVFDEDSIGQATLLLNSTSVRVEFSDEYATEPIITVTPIGLPNFFYGVDNIDATGFDIEISEAQPVDFIFNWHAFAQPAKEIINVTNETEINITNQTGINESIGNITIEINETITNETIENISETEVLEDMGHIHPQCFLILFPIILFHRNIFHPSGNKQPQLHPLLTFLLHYPSSL